tara:strand:- start:130 stop:333 length:204 start_codon:yes stop_codon:yes gene_type:complete
MINRAFNHALPVIGNRNVSYHGITSSPDLLDRSKERLFSSPGNSHECSTSTEVLCRTETDSRTASGY